MLISDYDGDVPLTGRLIKSDLWGDGANGRVFLNGAELISCELSAGDSLGRDFPLKLTLQVGGLEISCGSAVNGL